MSSWLQLFTSMTVSSLLFGCAYRFSNLAMTPPDGITTIAVEAVYDTSKELIPHHLLWQSLQQSFARNGRILITNQKDADALLRIHFVSASVHPTGTPSRNEVYKDPKVTKIEKPKPSLFKNLTRAGHWTTDEALQFSVKLELWNLNTKKLIKTIDYSRGSTFKSFRSASMGQINTHYLLYEESITSHFKSLSKSISDMVVSDLLL